MPLAFFYVIIHKSLSAKLFISAAADKNIQKGGINVIGLFSKLFGHSGNNSQEDLAATASGISKRKRAVAFVDFEHWYISLDKFYKGARPDIKAFRDELNERYEIIDIAFFGDFSNPSLRSEIQKIREVSNTIIETQTASEKIEKDFTDFIMLDQIYQRVLTDNRKEIEAYVIFSGDGHFSSVASFLLNKCRKEVGIWGVKGSVSGHLHRSASYLREVSGEKLELPTAVPATRFEGRPQTERGYERNSYERNSTERSSYDRGSTDRVAVDQKSVSTHDLYIQDGKKILDNLRRLREKSRNTHTPLYPTYYSTIDASVKYSGMTRERAEGALQTLIEDGYVNKTVENIKGSSVKILRVNWNKVFDDKLLS